MTDLLTTTDLSQASMDLSLVDKKRKQWLEERSGQTEWFPFGKHNNQQAGKNRKSRLSARTETQTTLSPSYLGCNCNSNLNNSEAGGCCSSVNQCTSACCTIQNQPKTSTSLQSCPRVTQCPYGHSGDFLANLNSPCCRDHSTKGSSLPSNYFCQQLPISQQGLLIPSGPSVSAPCQNLTDRSVLGVHQDSYSLKQVHDNSASCNVSPCPHQSCRSPALYLQRKHSQIPCETNFLVLEDQQTQLLEQKHKQSSAGQTPYSLNPDAATSDISYTEQWASSLPQWQQFETSSPGLINPAVAQRFNDLSDCILTCGTASDAMNSTIPLMNQLSVGYQTSTPVHPRTHGQNGCSNNCNVRTAYVSPMICGANGQTGHRMAVVSPMLSKTSSLGAQENVDWLSASFSDALLCKPSSLSDFSPSHKRHNTLIGAVSPEELVEKQNKLMETRVVIEQQIAENRRKKLEEAERERLELEKAERERRIIERREEQGKQLELNKWKELKKAEEDREASILVALERANIEAREIRKERLYRHASLNRKHQSGRWDIDSIKSPNHALEVGTIPTSSPQATCLNCASDSSGCFSANGAQMATSSNFSDWSAGSPEEKQQDKERLAIDHVDRRSTSLPPFGGQHNNRLSVSVHPIDEAASPALDDRPIKPMTDETYEKWLQVAAEQIDFSAETSDTGPTSLLFPITSKTVENSFPVLRGRRLRKSRSVGVGSKSIGSRNHPNNTNSEHTDHGKTAPQSSHPVDKNFLIAESTSPTNKQPIRKFCGPGVNGQATLPRSATNAVDQAVNHIHKPASSLDVHPTDLCIIRRKVAPPLPPPVDKRSNDRMDTIDQTVRSEKVALVSPIRIDNSIDHGKDRSKDSTNTKFGTIPRKKSSTKTVELPSTVTTTESDSRLHTSSTYVIRRDEISDQAVRDVEKTKSGKAVCLSSIKPAVQTENSMDPKTPRFVAQRTTGTDSGCESQAKTPTKRNKACNSSSTTVKTISPLKENQRHELVCGKQIESTALESRAIEPIEPKKLIRNKENDFVRVNKLVLDSSSNQQADKTKERHETNSVGHDSSTDVACPKAVPTENSAVLENPWGDQFGGLNPLLHRLSTRKKIRRATGTILDTETVSTSRHSNLSSYVALEGNKSPKKHSAVILSSVANRGASPCRDTKNPSINESTPQVVAEGTKLGNLPSVAQDEKHIETRKYSFRIGDSMSESIKKADENQFENSVNPNGNIRRIEITNVSKPVIKLKDKERFIGFAACNDKEKAITSSRANIPNTSIENLNNVERDGVKNKRDKLLKLSYDCLNNKQDAKLVNIDHNSSESSKLQFRNPLYRSFNLRTKQPSEKQVEMLKQLSSLKEQLKKSQKVAEDTSRTTLTSKNAAEIK